MRLATALLLGALLLPAAAAAAVHRLESEPKVYRLEGAEGLSIEFSVGQLSVEGDDGDDVRVSVQIRCRQGDLDECQERARWVTIDRVVSGGRLRLKFNGIPKTESHGLQVSARLLVPRALATRIEMGVGELTVREMRSPLDLDLGVGELDVRGPEHAYRSALAETGVGDASVRTRAGQVRDRGFIGRSAHWDDGAGASGIRAHVGVGDASIDLR